MFEKSQEMTNAWNITQHANNEVHMDWCKDFSRLPITFANGLDPDQDQQLVGPDLDPNCLILCMIAFQIFF